MAVQQIEVGVLDDLAVECAAARAEIRARFEAAQERARAFTLPDWRVRRG
jgi:hypothetical protein